MESLLTTIADYLWRQSWQIALLVVAVGLASWTLRNRSAHVRYLLWLLESVKGEEAKGLLREMGVE